MKELLNNIQKCTVCSDHLPLGANPIVSLQKNTRILLISQAPGIKAHESSIAWKDPSGIRLREWLNVGEETFYNPQNFGIMPMGFCYPGRGKSGDLPPRKECAPLWHPSLFEKFTDVRLMILIGQYAQKRYLTVDKELNLTQRVQNFAAYLPDYFVLPHPSPRNAIWRKKNSWFEHDVVPILQKTVKTVLA